MAVYGYDIHGMPVRNLVRHKREYPSSFDAGYSPQAGRPAGTDQANQATDDDYELRRARTPVPTFVAEAVEAHLARIYSREVHRDGPAATDRLVEERRRPRHVDRPVDVRHDRPAAAGPGPARHHHRPPARCPTGEEVRTRADEVRLGLDACVASYILPENMVWWRSTAWAATSSAWSARSRTTARSLWRYWNASSWTLYDAVGRGRRAARSHHAFGRVPIVRVFDRRRPRCRNIGLPRYESHRRDPARVLQPRQRADPLRHDPGPSAAARARRTSCRPTARSRSAPTGCCPRRRTRSGGAATYEGFDVVPVPQGRGRVDPPEQGRPPRRRRPRGAADSSRPARRAPAARRVAQSGVSKRLDQAAGNDLLSKIAAMLGRAEQQLAELALTVLGDGAVSTDDREAVRSSIRRQFDLFTGEELAADDRPVPGDPRRGRQRARDRERAAAPADPADAPGPRRPGLRASSTPRSTRYLEVEPDERSTTRPAVAAEPDGRPSIGLDPTCYREVRIIRERLQSTAILNIESPAAPGRPLGPGRRCRSRSISGCGPLERQFEGVPAAAAGALEAKETERLRAAGGEGADRRGPGPAAAGLGAEARRGAEPVLQLERQVYAERKTAAIAEAFHGRAFVGETRRAADGRRGDGPPAAAGRVRDGPRRRRARWSSATR